MTRERTVLCMLAALGAAAFAVDRLFLSNESASGPSKATARTSPPAPATGSAPGEREEESQATAVGVAPNAGSTPSTNPGTPLLHRMRELPEAMMYDRVAGLDAFRPPTDWLPDPVANIEEDPPPESDLRLKRFVQQHRLTAIMTGPAGDLAVIGGRTLRLGQELDGFTLIALETRSALFRTAPPDSLEVRLTLPEPSAR